MRKWSMQELGRKSVEDFKQADKTPLVVVLDNIRSMHNVGSVFRSADAFLIEKMVLCGYTPIRRTGIFTKRPWVLQKPLPGSTPKPRWKRFNPFRTMAIKYMPLNRPKGAVFLHEFNPGNEEKG